MKILLLPSLITLLPAIVLFLILKYQAKNKKLSLVAKIILSVLFIVLSFSATFYAMIISLEGMAEKQIQCATGVAAFIPLGLLSAVGVAFLLFSNRGRNLHLRH
jgi:hypothetical protein